jgi:hypothetical protein
MPMTSADIAQQTAMGQQSAMMAHQSAGMLSDMMRRGADPQFGAEGFAGRIANNASAIGMPAAGMAAGLLGLDPFGMGMKGFGAARSMGMGMGGALGVGVGAFGVASAGASAAAFAANQMNIGAQQQQQFIRGMQSSYNFQTPNGMGFTNNQLGGMGQQLRSMSSQVGPLGEMASFGELSSLAQNMGKMGMMNGTQDVSSFTQNFRKMLDTVKVVAKELGTSLTEAQSMMSGMRNSGVFRASDQMQVTKQMRDFSIAGNLALPELTQAMGIGSQVSRAVGGLGKHGAQAGLQTLGNIGLALQSGTITDEDIYNSTGMRGAEGRQALAASQMQRSAGWLRGGRGRRFLASMAGADGNLDADSVQDWMNGGVGTGQTMGKAGRNLSRVGREDFINNEGRLRGAALAQFGGNIPAMAMDQWLQSRGHSVETADDRMMLLAQRQLGMGKDEADMAFKLLRGMPAMREQSRLSAQTDEFRQEMAGVRRTTGLEGAKRKMEATREAVQNKLQGTGQQMYSDLVEHIDEWLQKKSGVILEQASKDIDKSYAALIKGQGGRDADVRFGIGSGKVGGGTAMASSKTMSANDFTKSAFMGFGDSMQDKVGAAGYGSLFQKRAVTRSQMVGSREFREMKDVTTMELNDAGVAKGLELTQAAFRGAMVGNDALGAKLGAKNSKLINELYSGGAAGMKSVDRLDHVIKQLDARKGDPAAAELAASLKYDKNDPASVEQAMNRLSAAEGKADIASSARLNQGALPPGLLGAMGLGSQMGTHDRLASYATKTGGYGEAFKRNVLGFDSKDGYDPNKGIGANMLATAKRTAGVTARIVGNFFGLGILTSAKAAWDGSQESRTKQQEGQFRISDEGMNYSADILQGKDRTGDMDKEIQSLSAMSHRDSMQEDRLRMFKQMRSVSEKIRTGKQNEFTDEDKRTAASMQKSLLDQQSINLRYAQRMFGKSAETETINLRRTGFLDDKGNLSKDMGEKMAGLGGGAMGLEKLINERRQLLAEGGGASVTDARRSEIAERLKLIGGDVEKAQLGMDPDKLRAMAKLHRQGGDFGGADELADTAARSSRMQRMLARGGNIGGMRALGFKVGRADAGILAGAQAGDGKLENYLREKLGVSGPSDDDLKKLESELEADTNISPEEKQRKRAELKEQRATSKKNDVLSTLIKGVDSAKTPEEKRLAMLKLEGSNEFKEKKAKEADAANPALTASKETAANTKSALDILRVISTNTADKKDGATQPGK